MSCGKLLKLPRPVVYSFQLAHLKKCGLILKIIKWTNNITNYMANENHNKLKVYK